MPAVHVPCAIDAHTHTIASGHAYSTVAELAAEAARKRLEAIAITDHAPNMPGAPSYLHFLNLHKLPKTLLDVRVLTGVELNILNADGDVDLGNNVYKNLDVVIASLHVPCFKPLSVEEHTSAVINAMKNPYIKIIGHLGDPRYPIDIKKTVDAAKKTGTAIEINNVSLNPDSDVRIGGAGIVKDIALECKAQDVHVIMGSDAHFYTEVGELYFAQKLLAEIDYPQELILNRSVTALLEFVSE